MIPPMAQPATTLALRLALAAVPLALGACAQPLNSRDTLGATLELESIASDERAGVRVAELQTAPLTEIDRTEFAQRRFIVPVDAVRHQPTYLLTGLPEARRTDSWRSAGAYPTAPRSLDTQGDAGFEAWNALVGPLAGGLEIAASPVGMVLAPPWTQTQSPAPRRAPERAAKASEAQEAAE